MRIFVIFKRKDVDDCEEVVACVRSWQKAKEMCRKLRKSKPEWIYDYDETELKEE